MATPRDPSSAPAPAFGVDHVCPLCQGRRHRRSPEGGWVRCDCLTPLLNRDFIVPLLRPRGALRYPEALDAEPPWPLEDRVMVAAKKTLTRSLLPAPKSATGSLEEFQFQAWRALMPYRDRGLVYDAMDSYRVQEINFTRDGVYGSLLDLQDLHLLILLLGIADVPNRHLSSYLVQVLTMRRLRARPTWVWSPLQLPQVQDHFSPELRDMLAEMGHAA